MIGLSKALIVSARSTLRVNATGFSRPRLVVSGDVRGVVGLTGSRLLADLAEVTGSESGFLDALAPAF